MNDDLLTIAKRLIRDAVGDCYDPSTGTQYGMNQNGIVILSDGIGYDPITRQMYATSGDLKPGPFEDYNAQIQREARERGNALREERMALAQAQHELYLAQFRR